MHKIVIYGLNITLSTNNIHIENSYNVELPIVMDEILTLLRKEVDDTGITMDTPLNHRSNKSMIREWIAHNNLYILGYEQERTAHLDLNWPQKWYVKVAYWLLSRIVL